MPWNAVSVPVELENGSILLSDDIGVEIINDKGIEWTSPRISWDGIEDLKLNGNVLTGLSYDPTDEIVEWKTFEINLSTKEIKGSIYKQNYTISKKLKNQKPWWKIFIL